MRSQSEIDNLSASQKAPVTVDVSHWSKVPCTTRLCEIPPIGIESLVLGDGHIIQGPFSVTGYKALLG